MVLELATLLAEGDPWPGKAVPVAALTMRAHTFPARHTCANTPARPLQQSLLPGPTRTHTNALRSH